MNIFNSLRTYATKWAVKANRAFSADEINSVTKAEVVPSQYGSSVCFHMKSGAQTFMPLSNDSTLGHGDSVDLTKAEIVTLSKEGEADIYRVKA